VIRASSGKTAAARMLIGVGALALLIPAVAGCEAGNDAPTLEFHSASSGAHTVFNDITITNVFVLGAPSGSTVPAGSSASLFLALYNDGSSSDKLLSVTAPGTAASVSLSGGTVALPANAPVNLTGPQPEVELKDLKAPLTGGSNIPLTLTFQHAGTVNLTVPVQAQSFYYSTYSPAAAPSATK
jgi:copper(I)-binding protein